MKYSVVASTATSDVTVPATYRVRDGDDLGTIAGRFYGQPAAAAAIWAANRTTIPDPTLLPIGAELTLPPPWAVSGPRHAPSGTIEPAAFARPSAAPAGTTAAVSGAWVALAAALARLQRRGVLEASPLRQQVAAISVGLLEGRALLDLDYSEDSRAEVDLNVVMDDRARLLEIQGTAEGAPFSRSQLDVLLDLAAGGITHLQEMQRRALASAPLLP